MCPSIQRMLTFCRKAVALAVPFDTADLKDAKALLDQRLRARWPLVYAGLFNDSAPRARAPRGAGPARADPARKAWAGGQSTRPASRLTNGRC
jgi:hypothetical protein